MSGGSGSNAKSFTVAVEEDDAIDSIFRKIYRAENFNFVRISGHWDINSHDKLMFLWNYARGEANRALSVSTTGASDLKLFEFSISADGDTLYKTCGDGWKTKHLAWDTVIEINGESFSAAGYSVYDDEKRLNITANYPCGSIKVTIAAETAALARENILQEASGSILVTANHSSEMILSLLQN